MARAPWVSGKTRLGRGLGLDALTHSALRHALFLDTLDVVVACSRAQPIIACEPAAATAAMRAIVAATVDVIPQRGADLGERLAHAFDDVFSLGAQSVLVVGSDVPDLPARMLGQAFDALAAAPRCVVLGPAADGGYYLIGMTQSNPSLFKGIEWGTDRVQDQTLAAARRAGLTIEVIDVWADVDEASDLARLARRAAAAGAVRTRAWLRNHP